MAISFLRPWLLLLILPCVAFVLWSFWKGLRVGTSKERWATARRCLVVVLLILALAGMNLRKYTDKTTVFFVVDLSASMADVKDDMELFIQNALKNKSDRFHVGIITLGKDALVEQPAAGDLSFEGLETAPDMRFTNIDAGMQLAAALMPGDTRKKIVLLTDGNQNAGDALQRAGVLAEQGIRVDGVFFNTEPSYEVQVTLLEVPNILYEGETYDINVTVYSTINTSGILRLYANRKVVVEQKVELQKGENRFVFSDTARESGIKTYEVAIEADDDTIFQNNRVASYVNIKGRPVVAVVEGHKGEGRELVKILQSGGIDYKIYTPDTLPAALDEIGKYHSVILCNVSADDLKEDKIAMLEEYVRHLGRGLLVTGGDNSYALGGYLGTRLEKILPVEMTLPQNADIPSLGLILVIDKSGSMAEGQYGISKLDLAKEAAIRSGQVLRNGDWLGVIAFDGAASWIIKTRELEDAKKLSDYINSLRAGGGTNMYPALELAYESLKKTPTKLKHVIVLTDGRSQPGDFEGLVKKMAADGITLSSVAVGMDADTYLLEQLSRIGNGRYYFTDEFSNIPKIFTKETYLAAQSYIQNRTFYPLVRGYSPIMSGIDSPFPPVHGYIVTTPKSTATVVLSSDRMDPLLAEWQYGLGQVVAWTSDTRGGWSRDWFLWEQSEKFWLNVISHLLPSEEKMQGTVETARTGDTGQITVMLKEGVDEVLVSRASVLDPEGVQQEIELKLVEPGKYRGEFPIEGPGVYLIRVDQRKEGKIVNTFNSGLVATYSPEYDLRNRGSIEFLKRIVSRTGGKILQNPQEVFIDDMDPVWSQTGVWHYLITLALLLFMLDIALRRLNL